MWVYYGSGDDDYDEESKLVKYSLKRMRATGLYIYIVYIVYMYHIIFVIIVRAWMATTYNEFDE